MKKSLLCILSFILLANAFSATKKTGWEQDGLKGKVKERIEINYDVKKKDGKAVKEIIVKAISRYGDNGEKLEWAEYKADGTLTQKSACKYDAKGYLIEKDYKSKSVGFETIHIYKYDGSGNQIEQSEYRNGGALSAKDIYKYDGRGNRIEMAGYGDNGILCSIILYKYDDMGNRVEVAEYKADGTLGYKKQSKYDQKGNLIEECVVYCADMSMRSKVIYKYNDMGNEIERTFYNADESLRGKTISKYYEKGDMTEEAYKADGDLTGKYIKKYDNTGNWIELLSYDERGTLTDIAETSYKYY